MAGIGELALLATGLGLGLRHGIDWDHIAAITDITGTMGTSENAPEGEAQAAGTGRMGAVATARPATLVRESRWRFFLATLYAVGHAIVVVILGLIAIWTSSLLPEWIDPLMERIVGITLLLLGVWIFYSLWRYGRDFRLRSRWMLVFALIGRGWARLKGKLTGQPLDHDHDHGIAQYGVKTALGIGMIHGIGAETGSQALLLAGAAGATTQLAGSAMLVAFVIGLIISNSLIAAFSAYGFVSSRTRQNVYLVVGAIAGVFSLIVGFLFTTGMGTALPDIQEVLDHLFG